MLERYESQAPSNK